MLALAEKGWDSNSGAKQLICRASDRSDFPRYLGMCLVDFFL